MKIFKSIKKKGVKGNIYIGDALEFLGAQKKNSASIIFLDPPFNLGKRYSSSNPRLDKREEYEYELWMKQILLQCIRILEEGGSLYLYHFPYWAIRFGAFLQLHLTFRHWIAVSMKNGFVRGQKLYPAHYALQYFSKGTPLNFKRPKLTPKKCRHCGQLVKDYGGYREIIEKKGINLSDIWDDLSPVRHARYKHRKTNELPNKLLQRVIEISGSPGNLYVDPFAGSGTGVIEAAKAGMRFKACDIVESNCKIIVNRLFDKRSLSNQREPL